MSSRYEDVCDCPDTPADAYLLGSVVTCVRCQRIVKGPTMKTETEIKPEEQDLGMYECEAAWSLEAYPKVGAHKPEPGDRVYRCVVTVSTEEGEVHAEMTFSGDEPESMLRRMKDIRLTLLDKNNEDSSIYIRPEEFARPALEHFWWIVFGVRYNAAKR